MNRAIRELGPISPAAPAFPLAVARMAALRAKAESRGSSDFSPLWAGQNTSGCKEGPAAELTQELARGVLEVRAARNGDSSPRRIENPRVGGAIAPQATTTFFQTIPRGTPWDRSTSRRSIRRMERMPLSHRHVQARARASPWLQLNQHPATPISKDLLEFAGQL